MSSSIVSSSSVGGAPSEMCDGEEKETEEEQPTSSSLDEMRATMVLRESRAHPSINLFGYTCMERNTFLHIAPDGEEGVLGSRGTQSMPIWGVCSRGTMPSEEEKDDDIEVSNSNNIKLPWGSASALAPSCERTSMNIQEVEEEEKYDMESLMRPWDEGQISWVRKVKTKEWETREENGRKCVCTFFVGIADWPGYRVARRIIGRNGVNMRFISQLCPTTKLRLRGKGSGYREGDNYMEANVPMQINMSCRHVDEYEVAKREVSLLLESLYEEYRIRFGKNVWVNVNEHPSNPQKRRNQSKCRENSVVHPLHMLTGAPNQNSHYY